MTPGSIASLLQPYVVNAAEPYVGWSHIHEQLSIYLALILKWNARTNLTAIRTPDEIVRRHFGESLFLASRLGPCDTLLDFGSGAGFPGIPIQLTRPDLPIILAESQGKKAAFLREVARNLSLKTKIWPARVESMASNRQFHTVTLRAVDDMESAIQEAAKRSTHQILILGTSNLVKIPENFQISQEIPLPESQNALLITANRI